MNAPSRTNPRRVRGTGEVDDPVLADALHLALMAAVRGPSHRCSSGGDFTAFLAAEGIDCRKLVTSGVDLEQLRTRFALYRTLVFRRVRGVLESSLPRTFRALEEHADDTLETFMEACPWTSPHLRDLVREFVEFARRCWSEQRGIAEHVTDLATYELAHLEVASAEDDVALDATAVSPNVTLKRRACTQRLRLRHSVHVGHEDAEAPKSGAYHVLVYRDDSHVVHTLELSNLAANVLEHLDSGSPLSAAVQQAMDALGVPLLPDTLGEVATLLDDLFTRGIFKGRQETAG